MDGMGRTFGATEEEGVREDREVEVEAEGGDWEAGVKGARVSKWGD